MAETKTGKGLTICRSELVAAKGALPVAVGVIVLEGVLGSRPVNTLYNLPPTAHVVVALSHDRTVFTLPGGKKGDDPSLLHTVKREIFEELGVKAASLPWFMKRRIEPAVSDEETLVDVSAYFIPGFSGEISPRAEVHTVTAVPIFGEHSVTVGGIALEVMSDLRLAA